MNARHRRLLALGVVALAGGAIAQAPPGPAVQQAYIKAASPGVDDNFGTGVALSGETLLVGSPREDSGASGVNGDETDESLADSGAAYVFVRSGTSWSQQAYLKATTPAAGDRFGTAVALSGDTAVVGAPGALVGGVHGGAAWVFVRSGGVWAPQAVLTAAHPGAGDEFGAALAISGDTLVVSARFEDSAAVGIDGDETSEGAGNSGAAWVFVRSGTVWSQQAYVKASNAGAGDAFGFSLALDGDTLAVGANAEDSAATGVNGDQTSNAASGSGAAYVFVRSGASWSQQAYLKASNTGIADAFGVSVALGGETLAVGANFEDSASAGVNGDQTSNAQPGAGAAYVFVRSGTSWSQQAYVKASNPGPDTFGPGFDPLT